MTWWCLSTDAVVRYAAQRGWSLPPATSATFLGTLGTLGTKTWITVFAMTFIYFAYIFHGDCSASEVYLSLRRCPAREMLPWRNPTEGRRIHLKLKWLRVENGGPDFSSEIGIICVALPETHDDSWLLWRIHHKSSGFRSFPIPLVLSITMFICFHPCLSIYVMFTMISSEFPRVSSVHFPRIFPSTSPRSPFFPDFPSFPGGSASLDLRGRPVGQCLQPSSSTRAADPSGRGLAAEPCRRHGRYQQHGVDLAVGGGGEPGGVDETARWGRFADSQGTWGEDRWTMVNRLFWFLMDRLWLMKT